MHCYKSYNSRYNHTKLQLMGAVEKLKMDERFDAGKCKSALSTKHASLYLMITRFSFQHCLAPKKYSSTISAAILYTSERMSHFVRLFSYYSAPPFDEITIASNHQSDPRNGRGTPTETRAQSLWNDVFRADHKLIGCCSMTTLT